VRIGIVNDSTMAAEVLRRVVSQRGGHAVAWVALDGAQAVALCTQDRPDLVLMDLVMPVMDGVEATRRIMQQSPCPVLVVTSTVEGNLTAVYRALGHGALDVVRTPELGVDADLAGGALLLEKVASIQRLTSRPAGLAPRPVAAPPEPTPHPAPLPPLLALGASTGGPKALADVLAGLAGERRVAVVIVQHVDAEFAVGLAQWLSDQSAFPVRVARNGERPVAGTALLAATNDHMVMQADMTLHYAEEPREQVYRPSVDVFFHSLLSSWPRPGVAAVLTGMGRDGADGLLALRRSGWHTVAQDQATSVLFGMPKAAAACGGAVEVLPLSAVAGAALRRLT
jgi:two-component system response regulator WspF